MNKIMFFLLASIAAYAQESLFFVSPQFGNTRTMGAGNVYSVHSAGAAALFSNPAAIHSEDQSQLYISQAIRPWASTIVSGKYYDQNYNHYAIKHKALYQLPEFSITVPFHYAYRKSMMFGLGFRKLYDAREHSTAEMAYTDDQSSMQWDNEIKGIVHQVVAAAGFTFSKHYSFGLTIGIPVYSNLSVSTESNIESMLTHLSKTSLTSDYDISADATLQFGFLYHTDFWKIGFTYFKNNQLAIGQISNKDQNGSISTQVKEYYRYPNLFTLGIAHQPLNNLWLFAQVENRSWDKIMYCGELLSELPSGYAVRGGLEFGESMQIRAGYAIESGIRWEAVDQELVQQSIYAGIGLDWNERRLDISACYAFSEYSETAINPDMPAVYNLQNLYIHLSFQQKLPFQISR